FVAFIKAALDYENEMRLPVEPWRADQAGEASPGVVEAPDAKTSTVRADEVDAGSDAEAAAERS
ncbi:MAG: CTP synthase, partial [Dietzia sp.]